MDREATLLNFTRSLGEAAAQGNWEALAEIDARLAAALPSLAGKAPWSAAERAALDALRQAHQAASAGCARELARLDERLHDLGVHRDGWLAYAETGELEDSPA